jgi:hypothetical protein
MRRTFLVIFALVSLVGSADADKAGNTGVTGGMKGVNNKVPGRKTGKKTKKAGNTGITGGVDGINNKVPGE